MEYNEPLNLSIKKKPIAVVTPSSSNKVDAASGTTHSSDINIHADETNERLDSTSPNGDPNETNDMSRTTSLPNSDESIAICNNNANEITISVNMINFVFIYLVLKFKYLKNLL